MFFVYSINMPNTKQNNEVEHINKEISLLQDRLKINKKSLNQFQNALTRIGRLRLKKNLSENKEIQKILKNIFKNKIKHIKKKDDLLKNAKKKKKKVKKERVYLKKD